MCHGVGAVTRHRPVDAEYAPKCALGFDARARAKDGRPASPPILLFETADSSHLMIPWLFLAAYASRSGRARPAGEIHVSLGQVADACRAFESGAGAQSRDPTTYQNLALLELNTGNRAAPARLFAEALSLDPTARRGTSGTEDRNRDDDWSEATTKGKRVSLLSFFFLLPVGQSGCRRPAADDPRRPAPVASAAARCRGSPAGPRSRCDRGAAAETGRDRCAGA